MASSPVLITPPTIQPLTLAEVKLHLRDTPDADDSLIAGYIAGVVPDAEGFLNRALLTSTWDLWLDDFPVKDYIELPYPPLQSVASVKYYDTDDTEYTMDSADYFVDTKSFKGRVFFGQLMGWLSAMWPGTPLIWARSTPTVRQ